MTFSSSFTFVLSFFLSLSLLALISHLDCLVLVEDSVTDEVVIVVSLLIVNDPLYDTRDSAAATDDDDDGDNDDDDEPFPWANCIDFFYKVSIEFLSIFNGEGSRNRFCGI